MAFATRKILQKLVERRGESAGVEQGAVQDAPTTCAGNARDFVRVHIVSTGFCQ